MKHQAKNIFGGEVQYFCLAHRYWKPNLLKLKDAGLENVTSYVQWATHLAGPPSAEHPTGILDFEGKTNPRRNLIHFLDLVRELDLELNLRCGSSAAMK
jgi:beta-galactosidase GanA